MNPLINNKTEAEPKDTKRTKHQSPRNINPDLSPSDIPPAHLQEHLNPLLKLKLLEHSDIHSPTHTSEKYNIPPPTLESWSRELQNKGEKEYLRGEWTRIRFMGRDIKEQIVHISNTSGVQHASMVYGISPTAIKHWRHLIETLGRERYLGKRVRSYTKEEKMKMVREGVERGVRVVANKYDIAVNTLEHWRNKMDTFGGNALLNTNTGLVFSPQKKVEIVNYYLQQGLKAAGRKYGCNTPSIYRWRVRLEELGYKGFLDYDKGKGEGTGGTKGTTGTTSTRSTRSRPHTTSRPPENNSKSRYEERVGGKGLLALVGLNEGNVDNMGSVGGAIDTTTIINDPSHRELKYEKNGCQEGDIGDIGDIGDTIVDKVHTVDTKADTTVTENTQIPDKLPKKRRSFERFYNHPPLPPQLPSLPSILLDNQKLNNNIFAHTNIHTLNTTINHNNINNISTSQQINHDTNHIHNPKHIFIAKMKTLLPSHLFPQFKTDLKRLVDMYQIKALHFYSNYNK